MWTGVTAKSLAPRVLPLLHHRDTETTENKQLLPSSVVSVSLW